MIHNMLPHYFYTNSLFWFRIFGYGLRFDRMQPTFVRRLGSLYNAHFISIGKWDVEFLIPGNKQMKVFNDNNRVKIEDLLIRIIPSDSKVAEEFGFSGFSQYIRR